MHVATRYLHEQEHEKDLTKPRGLSTKTDVLTTPLLFWGIKPS